MVMANKRSTLVENQQAFIVYIQEGGEPGGEPAGLHSPQEGGDPGGEPAGLHSPQEGGNPGGALTHTNFQLPLNCVYNLGEGKRKQCCGAGFGFGF